MLQNDLSFDVTRHIYDVFLPGIDAMMLQCALTIPGAWNLPTNDQEQQWFPLFALSRNVLVHLLRNIPKRWMSENNRLKWMLTRFHWFEVARIIPPELTESFVNNTVVFPWLTFGAKGATLDMNYTVIDPQALCVPSITNLYLRQCNGKMKRLQNYRFPNVDTLHMISWYSYNFQFSLSVVPSLKHMVLQFGTMEILDWEAVRMESLVVESIRDIELPTVCISSLKKVFCNLSCDAVIQFICCVQAPILEVLGVHAYKPIVPQFNTFSNLRIFLAVNVELLQDWIQHMPVLETVYLWVDTNNFASLFTQLVWPSSLRSIWFVNTHIGRTFMESPPASLAWEDMIIPAIPAHGLFPDRIDDIHLVYSFMNLHYQWRHTQFERVPFVDHPYWRCKFS